MTQLTTKCIICGSDEHSVVRDTLRYGIKRKVLRCGRCGFIYLESAQAATEYYSGETYRRSYGPDLKKAVDCREFFDTYLPFQKKIIDRMRDFIAPDMKVLDVGCSTGHFLHALSGLVKERIGLELNKEHVEFIRSNLDFKVYSDPIETVKITEGPFDLITSFQVLEHIDDPRSFLKSIAGYLKPDGLLYLELPNINDIMLSGYRISGYADFYYREPHVSYFSKDTLGALLEQAGFRGKISTAQDYNFLNHLHWKLTGKPQDNFTIGTGDPELIGEGCLEDSARKDLNDFIRSADGEYKNILIRHGLGESLTFLGKKI